MYLCKITSGHIFSIDINLSTYKFTFIPMVYLKLLGNTCFNLEIGWGTFFVEIVKTRNMSLDEIKYLFDNIHLNVKEHEK